MAGQSTDCLRPPGLGRAAAPAEGRDQDLSAQQVSQR